MKTRFYRSDRRIKIFVDHRKNRTRARRNGVAVGFEPDKGRFRRFAASSSSGRTEEGYFRLKINRKCSIDTEIHVGNANISEKGSPAAQRLLGGPVLQTA
jgi:hypothetical protein